MQPDAGEPLLFPELLVVDSQHHLVDRVSDEIAPVMGLRKFLIDDYLDYLGKDHYVIASVAVEGRAMYRATGPEDLRFVGETEFLNGQAAMAASGLYGPCLVGAGIIGRVDLRIGEKVREVLDAHIAAAPQRFKGVRQSAPWDADSSILGDVFDGGEGLLRQESFRKGFANLAPLGLSFDAFVLAPQLPDVLDLARRFPDTQIILDNVGQPVGVGAHAGRMKEEYPQWRRNITEIASCANVAVKLGGLGSFLGGAPTFRANPPATSAQLVAEWRPYVEVAVEVFGAARCMFESNRPTDDSGSFSAVCNAYKQMTARCSADERRHIFAGTAKCVYNLALPGFDGIVH